MLEVQKPIHDPAGVRYNIANLERIPLGTSYPDIVRRTGQYLERLNHEVTSPQLAIDATGVGRAVFDLFREAKYRPRAITITGGDKVSQDRNSFRVPKRDLVGVLQRAFQTGRLKIYRELPMASVFIEELMNFRVKISGSGHDSYEAWREGVHDDLVLAAAIALWSAEYDRTRPRAIFGPPL